ncbi:NADP-dependent oxidoreductase [Parasalinivibrio latis]|uniref:NADP-dependent oxidoreductase n=1 Tax=Parasalinivibrio latis TaxID=2952610 RepID=UPI0030DF3FA8
MSNNMTLVITAFGGPETLAPVFKDIPEPAAGEVLVRVEFAGVNPIDAKTRAGLGWAAQQNKDNLPWTPGYDMAGVIVATGEGVEGLEAGQRVAGLVGFPGQGGAYSQYLVTAADTLSVVPETVNAQTAAALPVAGQTAWQALEKAGVKAGEKVLILAGAGGVGHVAIQLAKALGADVFASCSQTNVGFVQALGASAVDYTAGDIAGQVSDCDVLIDLVGGNVGIAALDTLKEGGRVVTIPTITAEAVKEAAGEKALEADGMLVSPSKAQMDSLLEMADSGRLLVSVGGKYPLEQGAQAHSVIESGHVRGKLLLEMPN